MRLLAWELRVGGGKRVCSLETLHRSVPTPIVFCIGLIILKGASECKGYGREGCERKRLEIGGDLGGAVHHTSKVGHPGYLYV